MQLSHYSKTLIEKLDISRIYEDEIPYIYRKPNGLWLSVDGEDDWKEWCLRENFCLEKLSYKYEVILKKDANVITLSNEKEISEFSQKYLHAGESIFDGNGIDWALVKKDYQGIIITAYEFEFWSEHPWLYGWDCESGCIWDLSCIKEFNLVEHKDYK
jgi:hypothetical protein